MKKIITQGGISTDDKKVIIGMYQFCSTIGLSLSDALDMITIKNCLIDWQDYYITGIKAGEKASNLLIKIDHAVFDILGKKTRDIIINRLEAMRGSKD